MGSRDDSMGHVSNQRNTKENSHDADEADYEKQ